VLIFGDEAAVRSLLPNVVQSMGHVDAVVNSASTFEHDTCGQLQFCRHGKTHAQQRRSRHFAGAGAAQPCQGRPKRRSMATRPRGVVVNLLDQKLWNQNPDFFSYTLSKARWKPPTPCWPWRCSPQIAGGGRSTRLTLTSPCSATPKFKALHKLSPLGRSSTPPMWQPRCKFALENQSITGTTLLVDGGQHLMRFERDFSLM
jgi:NAD(P)-dependent dehydrogenase (short-subunit alcohol dehydrogenase family)